MSNSKNLTRDIIQQKLVINRVADLLHEMVRLPIKIQVYLQTS